MESCGECLWLENRLQRANNYYIRLILEQDRMMRDGDAEASAFEDAMQEAQSGRASAARDLLAHRGSDQALSLLRTRTSVELKADTAQGGRAENCNHGAG